MILSQLMFLLLLLIRLSKPIYVNSKELNVEKVADYTDLSLREKKTANVRDAFLEQKKQKDILRNFDRLISSDSMIVDGVSHYKVTSSWDKEKNIENDFKSLISMQYMKYEYLRDDHWRSWREVINPSGGKNIISYKCQSIVHQNCTGCEGKGVWVIEEGTPPCPYEIFSLKNSNELCVAKYTELNKNLSGCPATIKYAELTKTCNNPIVTRSRFTRNYKVTGRNASVICKERDYCEIMTLYQIYPEYVVFRILNSKYHIIFSRVMRNDNVNFACVVNCGVMDQVTFEVTQSKDNIINLLPVKAKRQNKIPNKYKDNIYSNSKGGPNNIIPSNRRVSQTSYNTTVDKDNQIKGQKWIRTDTGYYLNEELPVATTEYKRSKTKKRGHSTYYDSYEDIKEKFLSFY